MLFETIVLYKKYIKTLFFSPFMFFFLEKIFRGEVCCLQIWQVNLHILYL